MNLVLRILFYFVALMVVYEVLTRRYLNPYRLFLVFGKKGSGKTTFLIKLAVKHLKKGWHVYTNIDELCIPGVRHIDPITLGKFVPAKNSLLLLDEINLFWDNRNYKSFPAYTSKFFRLQRHYHVKVYLASQTYDCDKKIRDQVDGMYLNTCMFRVLSVGRRIYKKPVITASSPDTESRISEDLKIAPPWEWSYTLIPKWAKYFDSYAIPETPEYEYREDKPVPILEQISRAKDEFESLKVAFKTKPIRSKPFVVYHIGGKALKIQKLQLLSLKEAKRRKGNVA